MLNDSYKRGAGPSTNRYMKFQEHSGTRLTLFIVNRQFLFGTVISGPDTVPRFAALFHRDAGNIKDLPGKGQAKPGILAEPLGWGISLIARRINCVFPDSPAICRAFNSIFLCPIPGKSCSTSKFSELVFFGNTVSSVRSPGIFPCWSPGIKIEPPRSPLGIPRN